MFHRKPRNLKDPEPAFSEVSGRTFSGIVNRAITSLGRIVHAAMLLTLRLWIDCSSSSVV